ncbi:MAG: prolipoprotein diacylglyceryl transferase [Clostridia bacterium]|nr:prolipoprotein diacylglyceryl transferase [Clostridia bacterium]
MENNFLLDRVAFTIFGFEIYWYGVFMCLAIVAAIVVAMFFCKKREISVDEPINVALVSVPSGILCGRLFAVLFDEDLSIKQYFNFRTGGMSIIGCIIGGGIALAIYSFIKKDKDIFKYTDILCSVLLLAQAIGRWGNFFNGEIFGQVITDNNSIFSRFPFAVEINGIRYQALFFYESLINVVGFFFTAEMFLFVKKDGYTTGFYLIYYGVVRTILEKFRQDQFILKIGSAPISLICSILMIVAGVAIFAFSIYRNKKKKESK